MQIETIIQNLDIRTMDPTRPRARRIGVHRGRIVGLDEELDGLTASDVIDGGGRTALPGFNDAHAHSVWYGLSLVEVDLSQATSVDEIYDIVSHRARDAPRGEWLIASGLNPLAMGGAYPDRDSLDRAAEDRPLWIKHNSGHACVLNGVALSRLGIGDRAPGAIDGGRVVVDATGRPTGVLEETAMQLVQAVMLPYPAEAIANALHRATAQYLREGITSVTDAGIAGGWIGHSPREFGVYQSALEAGLLRTRMQTMISIDALTELGGHADDPDGIGLTAGVRSGVGNEWLQIGPAKVFTDGSLLAGTAYMSQEYEECAGHGYLQGDPAELRSRALAAARAGWALALHAIGDGALDFALDVYAEARRNGSRPAVPHRIEHGGLIRPEQIAELAKAGIPVVPQPHFINCFGDGMAARLGPERTDCSYPAASLLEAGIPLPGSSDRPVAPGAPLAIVQSFVERLTESGAVYGARERIGVEEALRAYTRGSAEVTGWAHSKGMLREGMLADLALLGQDPAAVRTDEISRISVDATILGGRVVFGEDALRG